MNKATATVHFSLCERVSHNYTSRDYLIARLPFVLQTPGDYPQSFEVHVKEQFGPPDERLIEVLVDDVVEIPVAREQLLNVATDFYRTALPTIDLARAINVSGGRRRIAPRAYPVELH